MSVLPARNWNNWHPKPRQALFGEAVKTPFTSNLCVALPECGLLPTSFPVLYRKFGINYSGPPVHGRVCNKLIVYRSDYRGTVVQPG